MSSQIVLQAPGKTATVDNSMVDSSAVNEPLLKTRIRRWRHYRPTTSFANGDGGGEAASKPSSEHPTTPLTKRVGVEFINSAGPRDATSAAAVSSIRSHAARSVHASRRRLILPRSIDSSGRGTRVDTDRVPQLAETWPASFRIPRIEALFQGIRLITKLEYFLLDYYVNAVIPESRNWCDHGEGDAPFFEITRLHWLPFIVSDTGLLAGVMLSACRNLALHERQGPVDCDYAHVATVYKIECIRSINAAIAAEGRSISDASIAKALMLCTDEAMCMNVAASIQHYEGMSQMIQLKGGLPSLGVGGFLEKAFKGCNMYEYYGKIQFEWVK